MAIPHLIPRLASASLLVLACAAFTPGRLTLAHAAGRDLPSSDSATAVEAYAREQVQVHDDWFLDWGDGGPDGNQATVTRQPTVPTGKRIVVSLGGQTLSAYDGDAVVLTTMVTTGGPDLPTPVGVYSILNRTTQLSVYSPWPKGSPYWFPDAIYSYALEFSEHPQVGLYIHDASWRTHFGPGSNADRGTPGMDDTGSHGCINVPLAAQEALYAWSVVGVPVIIQA